MNAFGKMGLLCCLAAVLLAGCGDGDRDVSAVSGPESVLNRAERFPALLRKTFRLARYRGTRFRKITAPRNRSVRAGYLLP